MSYHIEHIRTRRVRGWPVVSSKPFSVYRDNKFVAAFATRAAADAYIERKQK